MNRTFTFRNLRLLMASMMAFVAQTAEAVFTPVTLTGYNADVVANGVGLPTTSTNQAFDVSTYVLLANNYQQTGASPMPTWSLPASGTINSVQTSGLSFQLAAYTGNNSLKLTGTSSGTLTFSTPGLIGDVYILGASGDGASTATITVKFTDNTTQVFTGIQFPDWFTNTPFTIQGIGRANRNTGVIDNAAGASYPRLYERKLTLNIANYTKTIASIQVSKTTSAGALNIMAVTVDHQTCLPVQNMTASNITTTSADLSWGAVTGSQGYQYALQTNTTPPTTGLPATGTTYNATGLNVGTTYYLFVRNQCGPSTFSPWNILQFVTQPCPSAGTPTISNNVPGSVTISWPGSTAGGVVNYQYHVTTSATAPTSGWQTTTATSVNYSPLVPGTTYYAWVRTNCNTSMAAWSNSGSFVNPFPPCYEPTNITASNINMHGADIKWNASTSVPPAQGYQYSITTNPAPPASGTSTTDTSYTATNLTPGTTYKAYIRTHCATTNYSVWDSVVFTTPATCLAPTAPVVSNITYNSADITWGNYPGIHSFEYFINNSPTPPTFPGISILYNAVSPQLLNSGTTYYFHLRTRCDADSASPWTTTPFTTLTNCTEPSVPVLTSLTPTSASFSWGAVPNASNYEYNLDTSATPPPFGVATSLTTYSQSGLNPNTDYCLHVRAVCSMSDISTWSTMCFTTLPTGIEEMEGVAGFGIDVYPNPASDMLNIKLNRPVKGVGNIILTDVSGKTVKMLTVTDLHTATPVSDLTPGIYFLKYVDHEKTKTIRLMKQ